MFEVRTCLSVWCFEPINRFGHLQGSFPQEEVGSKKTRKKREKVGGSGVGGSGFPLGWFYHVLQALALSRISS